MLQMPTVDKALFNGSSNITGSELVLLEISDYGDSVTRVLHDFKWNNKAIGAVALELSPDNHRVDNGTFLVRGPLEAKEVRVKTSNLWATAAAETQLSIRVPDGSAFSFDDGSLCSDYLPCNEVTHVFTRTEDGETPTAIMTGELQNFGVGEFCLRLVCHLVRASTKSGVTLHYTVLAYPGTREEVLEVSELAQSASWPGLLLAEGDMPLGPMPKHAWQCPLLPLIYCGSTWQGDPVVPPAAEMRRAIGAIMARSTPPEAYKSRTGVLRNWEKYSNNPDEFNPKKSPVTWPSLDPPAPVTGRLFLALMNCSLSHTQYRYQMIFG